MKEYLVIQLARFGDLIQTKRLIATLCARDNASVHLCVDNSLKSLAEIVYPQVSVHSICAHGTGLSADDAMRAMLVDNRQAFARLCSIDFDTVYNLNFSPLNFRLAALFDADSVEGYAWKDGQELVGLWPSMAMRWSRYRRTGINLVDFWAAYCRDMIDPELVNPIAKPGGGGIGVVLAGRESRRSLPPHVLARIVGTIAQSGKMSRITLLGSKSEQGAGQAVIKELPQTLQAITANQAGKTDWKGLAEMVDSFDTLVTPDTGTMHLAAHLGTPVNAFFLSSAWCFETGPYGEGHTVYQAQTECLPCLETQPCPYDVKCLGCFTDPKFLRFLVTGKADHAPNGLLAMRTVFDGLGVKYSPFAGVDGDVSQRDAFRDFLLQYLTGIEVNVDELDTIFAERIYREKDWMADMLPTATIG